MNATIRKSFLAVMTLAAACGTGRAVDAYRADTQKLLDGRQANIKTCYDSALKTDAALGGTVTVQFIIEKTSGAISGVTVDTAKTTAPPALQSCVVDSISKLTLDPPDANEGHATFVYEFKSEAH
jgi:hypothetical protein